jgi:hypothetical protein
LGLAAKARRLRLVSSDHERGMVLVLRLVMPYALRSSNRINLDQDEGRVPLKPLPKVRNLMRFVRLLNTSRGPFSLGFNAKCRYVRLLSADHERGMVLVLRLDMPYAWIADSRVKLDQDEGRVPVKPLLETVRTPRFVRLSNTSSGPFRFEFPERSRCFRLVSADHESGMLVTICGWFAAWSWTRSDKHVMEAGRGTLVGRLRVLGKRTVVINDPLQVTPYGAGIRVSPGHGQELLYVEGDHVDSEEGPPKSV